MMMQFWSITQIFIVSGLIALRLAAACDSWHASANLLAVHLRRCHWLEG